jgi:hypothetical protein
MHRHWTYRTLPGLISLLLVANAWAEPQPSRSIGSRGVVPASGDLVPMTPQQTTRVDVAPKAGDIARNPRALVAFLKKNPDRMNVDTMNPALVLTMSELLLDGQAWFVSEKLLHQAVKKWSDRPDLKRAYGRVLIQLGRPDYAVKLLESVGGDPDAETQFLTALGLVRSEPKTEEKSRRALTAFRAVLKKQPGYVDASGWSARDIQAQIDRMLGVAKPRGARSPHP